MSHWQGTCPQFRESRTKAHNFVWGVLGTAIAKHATTLEVKLEQPMSKTSFHHLPAHAQWQPDGLAFDQLTQRLFVLEFMRCNDSRQHSLLKAMERKEVKYAPLCDALRVLNPSISITLLTFAVGYIGSIEEATFTQHLDVLGIPNKEKDKLIQATVTATLSAFGDMVNERHYAHNLVAQGISITPSQTAGSSAKPGQWRLSKAPPKNRRRRRGGAAAGAGARPQQRVDGVG